MPVPWSSTIQRQESNYGPPSQHVLDNFQLYYEAVTFPEAKASFENVLCALELEPGPFHIFFPKLKNRLQRHLPYKFQAIWNILEKKSKLNVYGSGIASDYNVLVVGGGPCGLKSAIETQFLGAQTVVVEKRDDFTRNNVLKLWKFLLDDLKSIGIKNLYGQFATGEVNHIGIKTLQLVLAKISLLIGIKIVCPITFEGISMPSGSGKRWTGKFSPDNYKLRQFNFDMIIVASGKNVPNSIHEDFGRHSLNAKLSIAVTANFVNSRSTEEQSVDQIAGLSKQYHQQFFKDIEKERGISLENIVYYKGDTHYFVMTATRKSLLDRGVLRENKGNRDDLMAPSNIDKENMYKFAIDAAEYSTEVLSQKLPTREFALDHRGNPDVSVFDFTDLYCASNASRVKLVGGHKLIMACVGDSLLQPFWPEGTGCARGFLSAMNAAWMLRRYAEGTKMLNILAERENLYKMLKQTTDGVGSVLKDEYRSYTIDPETRYKHISRKIDHKRIPRLYPKISADVTDYPINEDIPDGPSPPSTSSLVRAKKVTLKKLSNLIQFPQKAQRARHRKSVLRQTKREESANVLLSLEREPEEDGRNNDNTTTASNLPLIEQIEDEVSKMGIGEDNPYTNVLMKNPTKKLTSADAESALNLLKAFAKQKGINDGLLIDFEKLITN